MNKADIYATDMKYDNYYKYASSAKFIVTNNFHIHPTQQSVMLHIWIILRNKCGVYTICCGKSKYVTFCWYLYRSFARICYNVGNIVYFIISYYNATLVSKRQLRVWEIQHTLESAFAMIVFMRRNK